MTEPLRQRVRLRFSKGGDARFLSHHDLMHAWEMALRRSGLPLRMTEGYNPRIKLSMPLALGLGIASEDEILEVELEGWSPAEEIHEKLARQLPPGVALRELEPAPPGQRGQVDWVEYSARLSDEEGLRLLALLDQPSGSVERVREEERRQIDIRPYLLEVRQEGPADWRFRLKVTPKGTARPDEVLRAIGVAGPEAAGRLVKLRTELEAPRLPGGGSRPRR